MLMFNFRCAMSIETLLLLLHVGQAGDRICGPLVAV